MEITKVKPPQFSLRDLFGLLLLVALGCAVVVVPGALGKGSCAAALVAAIAWRRVGRRRTQESNIEVAIRWGESVIVVTTYAALFIVFAAIFGFGVLCLMVLVYGLPD